MTVAIWTGAFSGWDMAWAVESASAGKWGLAAVFVGMATLQVALGIATYQRQMRRFR